MSTMEPTCDEERCGLCLEPFLASTNMPRVLHCLHVYCKPCLKEKQVVDGSVVVCPSCQVETPLDTKGVDSLPLDHTIFRMKKVAEITSKRSKIMCQDCPDGEIARFFCKDCSEFQCQTCRDHHVDKRNKLARNHTVIELEEVTEDVFQTTRKPARCREHDQPLTFYCGKEECKVPICVSCIVFEHEKQEGHKIRKLNDVYSDGKTQIETLLKRAQNEHMGFVEIEEVVKKQKVRAEQKKALTLEEIQMEYEELLKLIEKRKSDLEGDVQKKYSSLQAILDKNLQEAKLEQKKRVDACAFVERTLVHSSDVEFINIQNTIEKRLDMLTKAIKKNKPVTGYSLHYKDKISDDVKKILSSSEDHVDMDICTISTTNVTKLRALCKQMSKIADVIFKDEDGNPVTLETDDVVATANIADTSVKCEVNKGADDLRSYQVFLNSDTKGKHSLKIEVFGQRVDKLNYEFEVVEEENKEEEFASEVMPDDPSRFQVSALLVDKETAHPLIHVSDDGKLLTRVTSAIQRGDRQLRNYRGGSGTISFDCKTAVPQYYLVRVKFEIKQQPKKKQCMVFEIGLCRREYVDNGLVVKRNPYSCSFYASFCEEHQTLCLKLRTSDRSVFHKYLSENVVGTAVDATYGFLFDSRRRTWTVVDCGGDVVLEVLHDLNLDQPLWPVFAIYLLPATADVLLTLASGEDIEEIPDCLKNSNIL